MPAHSRFPLAWSTSRWLALAMALLAALAWARGLQMARDRAARLQPARAAAEILLPHAEPIVLDIGSQRFLVLRWDATTRPARLALRQVFPERQLLRWLEAEGPSAQTLVVPLEGLEAGEYWLVVAAVGAAAGPEEMDQPRPEMDVLARLELRRGALSESRPGSD